jgi:hypothetical protein
MWFSDFKLTVHFLIPYSTSVYTSVFLAYSFKVLCFMYLHKLDLILYWERESKHSEEVQNLFCVFTF